MGFAIKEGFTDAEVQAMIGQTSSMVSAATGFSLSNMDGTSGGDGVTGGGVGGVFDMLTCSVGSECYKTKQNDLLKKMYDERKKIYENAPLELSQSEKNYFSYNRGNGGGQDIYNKLIIDRFARTAAEFKQKSTDMQQQFMSDIIQSIKQYRSAFLFKNQMANLLKLRKSEQNELRKNVNYYQKIIHTSERKVVYENKSMDDLYIYRRIMIFLYYSAIVCFIIFGNFIPDKLYTKYSVWLIIVIVAIIPIIMNMIIMWIFIIYDTVSYWFSELPHQDVYWNMGNPADEKAPPPPGAKPPASLPT